MPDYVISEFETSHFLSAGHQRRQPSFGRRLILWIETNQQRRADREIMRTLRRWWICSWDSSTTRWSI